MAATSGPLLLGRALRREHRGALVALACVVALGGATSLGFVQAALRTNDAYPTYVRDARVGDVVINPSRDTEAIAHAIAELPGVRSVHSDAYFLALPTTDPDNPLAGLPDDQDMVQVRGSTDGRYVETDRPIVERGRAPTGKNEVFVTSDYRDDLEQWLGHPVEVGDTLDMVFAQATGQDESAAEPTLTGTERLTVSGIGTLPDEVLPDDLYDRHRLVVSADVARRHDCTSRFGPDMADEQIQAELARPGCSRAYRYYSLQLDDGTDGVPAVVDGFEEAADRLNPGLPPAVQDLGGYYLVLTDRSTDDVRVERAVQPTVTILAIFGLSAATATLLVGVLMMVRLARRGRSTLRIGGVIGATRSGRAGAVMLAVAPSVLVGAVAAAVVVWLTSPVAPVGLARTVDPTPALQLQAAPTLGLIGALVAVLVMVAGVLGFRSRDPRTRHGSSGPAFVATGRPARDIGIRAALDVPTSGSGPVLLGCSIGVAVLVAATVFGTNLDRLAGEPPEFGWPWSVAVVTGAGYSGMDADAVVADLEARDDVQDWGLAAIESTSAVDGVAVPSMVAGPGAAAMAPAVVSGRLPSGPDEVALGVNTVEELGLKIGDTVPATATAVGETDATVVGTVVMPPLGQFLGDRAGLGVGAYFDLGDRLDSADASVVVIRPTPGTSGQDLVDGLGDISGWDTTGSPPIVHTEPIVPPEIAATSAVRRIQLTLGLTMLMAMALALALTLLISVRDRRRDLAILVALGFDRSQIRSSVRWQSMTGMAAALVLGVPLGWIVGRWAWLSFARLLGVRDVVVQAWPWLAGIVAVCLLLAWAVTIVPAVALGRHRAAAVLRHS